MEWVGAKERLEKSASPRIPSVVCGEADFVGRLDPDVEILLRVLGQYLRRVVAYTAGAHLLEQQLRVAVLLLDVQVRLDVEMLVEVLCLPLDALVRGGGRCGRGGRGRRGGGRRARRYGGRGRGGSRRARVVMVMVVMMVVMVVVMCGGTSGGQRFLLAHFIEALVGGRETVGSVRKTKRK